jgi:hypothetical protein
MPADPSYLQNVSCFRDLSGGQRKAVAQLATAICFPAGHVLFEEGKPGEDVPFSQRRGRGSVQHRR